MGSELFGAAVAACLAAVALRTDAADAPQTPDAGAAAPAPPPAKMGYRFEGWAPKPAVTLTRCRPAALAPGVEYRIKTDTRRGIATCYDGIVTAVDESSVRLIAKRSRVCRSYDVPLIFVGSLTTLRTGWCEDWKSLDDDGITIAKETISRAWLLKDKRPDGRRSVGPSLNIGID